MTEINENYQPTEFRLHATEFLFAAEYILNRSGGISLPAYYLFGLSVELSLKAFLLSRGMSLDKLKSPSLFGHNLMALLDEAQRRGLYDVVPLNQQESGVIKLLSYDYKMEKRLTYPVVGHEYLLPLIGILEITARKLAFGL